jgi:hypothetical protein
MGSGYARGRGIATGVLTAPITLWGRGGVGVRGMRGVFRRERGEGFFNRPRDACAMGAMMVMESDHETASYARDYRWCRVIDCGAVLASMVAQECAALA